MTILESGLTFLRDLKFAARALTRSGEKRRTRLTYARFAHAAATTSRDG